MINFMRFKWLYFLFSGMFIIPGIVSLVLFGLRPSIDFTGGSLMEYQFSKTVEQPKLENILKEEKIEVNLVQNIGSNTFLIRAKSVDSNKAGEIQQKLTKSLETDVKELRFETVGPTLGRELLFRTIIGVLLAEGFILLYVAYAFKNARFGICAILAILHDLLIMLGSFSLLGHFLGVEVDTLYVTALLTTLSFSVHDTVVVYDRIRESHRKSPDSQFVDIVNKSVTETLSRSLNNSLTVMFMLLAIILLGGLSIKWFAVALFIGTLTGTYSSTFTAVPLLVVWDQLSNKFHRRK
jgi:preprotein translocase subunit SecF